MRLHYVTLAHNRIEQESYCDANAGKAFKFCKMMGPRHEIFLYAPEGPPVPGATLVPCLSEQERVAIFGKDDWTRLPSWPNDAQSESFNRKAIAELRKRVEPRDIILLPGGWTHREIAKAFQGVLCAEPGVGYEGILGGNVHVSFESYFHMAQVYVQHGWQDIRWFDGVIPPFCDPDEFPILNNGRGEYLLFLGRLIQRKGPHIALQIAQEAGIPLLVIGAGGKMELNGAVTSSSKFGAVSVYKTAKITSQEITLEGNNLHYIETVTVEERAKWLAGACAVLMPTTYAEPGGNVALEAMMCGTPVIAPDWAVFSETIAHGVSGFHFRMFREAVEAVKKAGELKPALIRQYAVERYSLAAVAPLYDRWFARLQTLFGAGWYAE